MCVAGRQIARFTAPLLCVMEGEGQCARLVLAAKCNKMACTKAKRGDYSSVVGIAGWSSPVARQAHNLKAAGSDPAPATNF